MVLWLDEKLAHKIPGRLRKQLRRGLEIRLIEDNGPHSKIIHALEEFPDAIIVTADDDVHYPESWLEELLAAHEREPQAICCHRAHRMMTGGAGKLLPYKKWDWLSPGHVGPSLDLFPTGVNGVLYPPASLHSEVLNKDIFRKICPTADDVWLKAMSLLNHTPCQKVRPISTEWTLVAGTQNKTLYAQNVGECRNDIQLQAVFEHYDLHISPPAALSEKR